MTRAAALLLVGCAVLAACKPVAETKTVLANEAERATQLGKLSGWDKAFQPDIAVGAANQLGFHAQPYAQIAARKEFRAEGGPVVVINSTAKQPNSAAFKANGAAADHVDAISFDLTLSDTPTAPDARKNFAKLIRDYLFQSKIDATPVATAIEAGKDARGDLAGAPYQITKAPVDGVDHLTVTFNRTGASAPANS